MSAATKQRATIDGRELTFSNLDKVLWPQDGYTKGDLIAYYSSVARWLIPHLRDRPLTLERYPDGIQGGSFFEKQAPRYKPSWVPTVLLSADENSRKIAYVLCNDEATLAWCANLAAIVLHVWYSHVPTVDSPDYVLFDLDPWEGCTMKTLAQVALAFRETLSAIGLDPLVKTSGGSGLHVIVPLRPQYEYDAAKAFAEIVARQIAAQLPKITTLERTIARRPRGTVYLDWVQVGRGKTVVPPYVVRARARAPVSMPLEWSEVEALRAKARSEPAKVIAEWNIRTARARLETKGDPWAAYIRRGAALEPALRKAQRLWRGV